MPEGHREAGEDILGVAKRELFEETSAIDFDISAICIYSVITPVDWTYSEIEPNLLEEAR